MTFYEAHDQQEVVSFESAECHGKTESKLFNSIFLFYFGKLLEDAEKCLYVATHVRIC